MERMVTNNKMRIIKIAAPIIIFAMLITMLVPVMSKAGSDYAEITLGKLNMKANVKDEWKDYIVDGEQKVGTDTIMTVADKVKITIPWSVSEEQYENIEKGGKFAVTLPTEIFQYNSITKPIEVFDPDSELLIGSYVLSNTSGNPQIIFTFSDELIDDEEITFVENGFIEAYASLKKGADTIDKFNYGGETYEFDIRPLESNPTYEFPSLTGDQIYKSLYMPQNQDIATYTINAGAKEMVKYFNTGNVEVRHNVMIEDKLEEGQIFDSISKIGYMYYYAKEDGTLSTVKIYGDTGAPIQDQFAVIEDDGSLEYDEFKNKVMNSKAPCYGVWDDTNVVFNLGSMPGSIKFPVTIDELKEQVYNKDKTLDKYAENADKKNPGSMPQESVDAIKESTIKSYEEFYDNTNGGVPSVCIILKTKVNGDSRQISNTVDLSWEGNSVSKTVTGKYDAINVGASVGIGRSVELTKIDGDTEEKLNEVGFTLLRKNTEGEYVEFVPMDGKNAVRYTSEGSIKFNKLRKGEYKIVETQPLEGYTTSIAFVNKDGQNFVNENGEFEITEDSTGTIFVTAENFKTKEIEPETTPGAIEQLPTDSAVRGEVATPGAIPDGGDEDGSVLGEVAADDADKADEEGSVLGEEATTSDIMNMMPILIALGAAVLVILMIAIQRKRRKE